MQPIQHTVELNLESEAETDRLGEALLRTAPASAVVLLRGTLGAGKTRLVRGIAVANGNDADSVVSPTFVLCQSYTGRHTLHHLDAYRLQDDDEFLELGADEMMDSQALTFIEWGDRVIDCLPPDRMEVTLQVTDDTTRAATLCGMGEACSQWAAAVEARWNS